MSTRVLTTKITSGVNDNSCFKLKMAAADDEQKLSATCLAIQDIQGICCYESLYDAPARHVYLCVDCDSLQPMVVCCPDDTTGNLATVAYHQPGGGLLIAIDSCLACATGRSMCNTVCCCICLAADCVFCDDGLGGISCSLG